ncbi:hypothetical protein BU24DRAFT_399805 [Aaosphaeria arxii CBS 175.79]|uniref:Putative gamma-glutamylcyclotransferase n=1 Tax=Aaosphaeria arxii CBS 175.79 TaxID=1450172 RepID=A0A6A5XBI7_9PLEO|nr:uncharacterized protein BU24DRAFT_399805 [Aaosphaeria arxii CBS 175.79]KAF2010445.1 hypothetical protein BU24DRAFT_399805 [Aaosphaeria arxii CBS 175.79]
MPTSGETTPQPVERTDEGTSTHVHNEESKIPVPPPLRSVRRKMSSKIVTPTTSKKSSHLSSLSKTKPTPSAPPNFPCNLFFYGTLMDPEVLQSIIELPNSPYICHGSTTGFTVRMWGIYPALVPSQDGAVSGTVWNCRSVSEFKRLAEYETEAYTWCECDVRLESGEVLMGCKTFCWAGDANSKELEDGAFDLERYQRYFKASTVRRRPAWS